MSALPSIFAQYSWLWEPINEEYPCGKAIDYHPDFLALQQQLSSPLPVEYGEFIQAPCTIKWPSILPKIHQLSQQTKDIRLIILLIRAHLAQEGITAMVEGVALLIALLKRWPDELHPQCHDEGEYVPEFRYNALSDLDDLEGCIAELRRYTLTSSETEIYSFSDVEQWILRDKTSSLADKQRLKQCYDRHSTVFESCVKAQHYLSQLSELPSRALGIASHSFPHLTALLTPFCRFHQQQLLTQPSAPNVVTSPLETTAYSAGDKLAYRTEAREKLREIRENFAYYEPSSPLSLLLSFAENSIGLDYQQLSQRFPRELLSLLTLEKEL